MPPEPPLFILIPTFIVITSLFILFFWGIIRLWRGYHSVTDKAINNVLDEFNFSPENASGYILVKYQTYVGALFTVQERQWHLWVKNEQAISLLNSLFAFNIKRGLLTGFAPYVLFLTILNYFVQRWAIRSQLKSAS